MELKKYISTVVFWGAIWGIFEAIFGYMLHATNINFGWLFWFPIAFYFMSKVYKQTGKCESVIFVSLIAASIKLIDLALPVRIDKVINPAVSVLLECLVLFAVIKVNEKYGEIFKYKIPKFIFLSFTWRILYSVYIFILPAWMFAISPLRGAIPALKFFLIEGMGNAILIYLAVKLNDKCKECIKLSDTYLSAYQKLKEATSLSTAAFCLLLVDIFMQWVF